jgi:hypothetical protein
MKGHKAHRGRTNAFGIKARYFRVSFVSNRAYFAPGDSS